MALKILILVCSLASAARTAGQHAATNTAPAEVLSCQEMNTSTRLAKAIGNSHDDVVLLGVAITDLNENEGESEDDFRSVIAPAWIQIEHALPILAVVPNKLPSRSDRHSTRLTPLRC